MIHQGHRKWFVCKATQYASISLLQAYFNPLKECLLTIAVLAEDDKNRQNCHLYDDHQDRKFSRAILHTYYPTDVKDLIITNGSTESKSHSFFDGAKWEPKMTHLHQWLSLTSFTFFCQIQIMHISIDVCKYRREKNQSLGRCRYDVNTLYVISIERDMLRTWLHRPCRQRTSLGAKTL